jgi:HPt (histidine-containing phosphotransfer) domain-containing protein
MSDSLTEYFAQEAGEFLDQLDALIAASAEPDAVRLFRMARGVRGSSVLAGADAVAAVAEGLEEGARALRDGLLQWSPEVRERVRATVEDLRTLVAARGRWNDRSDGSVRRSAERWNGIVEGRRRGDRPGAGDELTAFVRREIIGVTEELGRVIGELAARPGARDPLRVVLRRMRPVRGLAGMSSLAPVLEVLEGVEDVAHEVLGRPDPATAIEQQVLAAAWDALRAAATALEGGAVPGELAELTTFRELRDRSETGADARAAVPVSRLFADGDRAPLVSSPMAPLHLSEPDDRKAFVAMEGTGFVDRAEGILSEAERHPRRSARATREAAELVVGVRELALLYGFTELATAAEVTASAVRASRSIEEARAMLAGVRAALPHPPPRLGDSEVGERPADLAVVVPPSAGRQARAHSAPPAAPPPAVPAPAAPAPTEAEPVPVDALLFAPADALREALALRPHLEALAGGREDGAPLVEALDELFDLVELGIDGGG